MWATYWERPNNQSNLKDTFPRMVSSLTPTCEVTVSSISVEQQIKFPFPKVQTQLSRKFNIAFLDSVQALKEIENEN